MLMLKKSATWHDFYGQPWCQIWLIMWFSLFWTNLFTGINKLGQHGPGQCTDPEGMLNPHQIYTSLWKSIVHWDCFINSVDFKAGNSPDLLNNIYKICTLFEGLTAGCILRSLCWGEITWIQEYCYVDHEYCLSLLNKINALLVLRCFDSSIDLSLSLPGSGRRSVVGEGGARGGHEQWGETVPPAVDADTTAVWGRPVGGRRSHQPSQGPGQWSPQSYHSFMQRPVI